MPGGGSHQLGVDFGTSNTVAVVRWPDGRARPLLFEGSPLLPSAVYAEPDGTLVVGRDAVHSARLHPARYEPNPKRRIDEGTLLLGDREVPVVDAIAAVLRRVTDEWGRTVGSVRPDVTLTCPAAWGATRRSALLKAATSLGFADVRLVAEPVAAATYFAQVLGRDVPIGSVVVVHDLGAGTFDASVVARTSSGFDVLAVDGRDDIGGLDVDAALVARLERLYAAGAPEVWRRLTKPSTVEDTRAKRLLWEEVRAAKERLSRTPTADLLVPLADVEVHLTRDELEELAKPLLDQTVRVTHGVIAWSNLAPGRLAGVFLVGGSSRIPLMATLLHRALGEAPVVLEQPELVVAEGSVHAGALALTVDDSVVPGPATGMLPRIPVDAFGPAGAPAAPGAARPGSAAPVSPAPAPPVSPARPPVSPAAPPVSPAAPPVSPAAPPVSPAAEPAAARSVGRVIVPGAQPPSRSKGPAAPVAPTRQLPRVDATAPGPPVTRPAQRPSAQRPPTPRPSGQRLSAQPPRRPGRLRRFVVRLLVAVLLLSTPIVAAYVAYKLSNGEDLFPLTF